MESKEVATVIREFLKETEKLKMELRHSYLSNGRQESVAEHVWRMSLLGMMVAPYLDRKINVERFLKIIIVHDIVEVYAGDVPITESSVNIEVKRQKEKNEKAAIEKIKKFLPKPLCEEIDSLWHEYEENLTPEAKIAHALDKIEAQAQHNEAGIDTWVKEEYHFAYKLPLYTANEKILEDISNILINEVNVMLKNTKHGKTNIKASILEHLEIVAPILPIPIYWEDTNSVILGSNGTVLEATGVLESNAYIGKTPYDIYPKEIADTLVEHAKTVMQTGKATQFEECIQDFSTGEDKYFNAIKVPLRDDVGNIIGVIGTAIEITEQKKAEALKIENTSHKLELEKQREIAQQQVKFNKIVGQMIHDIGAPVASIIALAKTGDSIPEPQRIALRNAGIRINDLTKNLLAQYESNKEAMPDERRDLLVSDAINQILSEKRMQHYESLINFESDFSQDSHFAFVHIDAAAFKRTLSNLINNAVDAFDGTAVAGKVGIVTVKLKCDANSVYIILKDNGKGMRPELVNKIVNNISVTEGKTGGHGIGLSQVRETIQLNDGKFKINSTVGQGTEITLTFPKISSPPWIADHIKIYADDIVVILDDDTSIHAAWNTRFANDVPQLINKLNHFESGQETINFINNLSPSDKQKVFLLVDYELLNQKLNGLDVVKQTGITRSILVTSHNENRDIQAQAHKTHTKILPKLLAAEIPISVISIEDTAPHNAEFRNYQKQVDLVVIDDNTFLTDTLRSTIFKNKNVDIYNDLQVFIPHMKQYAKETKFLIDNNYDNYKGELRDIRTFSAGFDLAKILYELGFTNLYLFSGDTFKNIPDYLRVINKAGIDEIEALIDTDSERREKLDLKQQLWNVIENFNRTNCHNTGYNAFYDLTDIAYEIKEKPAKMLAYLDRVKRIGESIRDDLQYEVFTIARARRIFDKNATQENDLLECDFEYNLIDSKLKFALNENQRLLNQDIRHTFKYMGNIIIVDMIVLNLLRYAVSQIQQSNRGKIYMNINKHGKSNKFYIRYDAPGVNTATPEDDNYYAKNYEFCKNAMHLFGGSLTTHILNNSSVEFLLAFPKIKKID
ncbi:MAG: HD domain-containing protein [Burkholderiales bacterium]|nr:HD domain-containing protein [Burkholderiales bacterium]